MDTTVSAIQAVHPNAHLDELVGAWIIDSFRGDEFADGEIPPIGHSHSIFDEHLQDGARIPGECAATCIANHLEMLEDPRLVSFLSFVLQTDEGKTRHGFDLAAAVLLLRRVWADNSRIYSWVCVALQAYWETVDSLMPDDVTIALHQARNRWDLDLQRVLAEIGLGRNLSEKARALSRLVSRQPEKHGTIFADPFDVVAFASIIATRYGVGRARAWFKEFAQATLCEQLDFRDAVKEIWSDKFERIKITTGRREFRIASGRSDNVLVAKASRSEAGGKAAVLVQQISTGNVLIHVDPEQVEEELSREIERRIKKAEPLKPDIWYYHVGSLFNGTSSVPQLPTGLPLEQIADLVCASIRNFRINKH